MLHPLGFWLLRQQRTELMGITCFIALVRYIVTKRSFTQRKNAVYTCRKLELSTVDEARLTEVFWPDLERFGYLALNGRPALLRFPPPTHPVTPRACSVRKGSLLTL